jgi:Carboxypeptidase regulatory-like domain
MKFQLLFSITAALFVCSVSGVAQRPTSLRGQVSDQVGAVIIGATVTLTDANGKQQTTQTDSNGSYRFDNVAPGAYTLTAAQTGFATETKSGLQVAAGTNTCDFQLAVTIEEQRVTVDDMRAVNTDPNSNRSARVIAGKDLNALSDDPNELAAQLDALAGPAAGPSGTQVFVDGFTAAPVLPDKQTISQIVINQNPFSAEFERIGFGNIQIFTRPGTGKLHGSGAFLFNDDSFNSRNPYAVNKPPYTRRSIDGTLSGPLGKKASFFVFAGRRDIGETAVINAVTLNSALDPVTVSAAVLTPRHFTNFAPRFDYLINKNNTLSLRYNLNATDLNSQGIGGTSLPSRAFDYSDRLHIFQAIDMAILNPRTVNEFGFQYIWYGITQTTRDPASGLIVNDSFSGGGSQIGHYSFDRDEGEARNYTTMTLTNHTIKFGARLRWARISDIAPTNFGGTFIFSSLDKYRRTLQGAATPDQLIIANGDPFAKVFQWDIGPFVQDDWKVRPDFTLSAGLRYQYQTNLNSKFLFAPRVSFAWTPWFNPKGQPKTVFRGGVGVFYDLIRTSVTLQANRYDGNTEQQYIVTSPALLSLFPNTPPPSALTALSQPQTIWRKVPTLTEPYYIQSSFSVERALPKNTTLSISFVNTRGLHQLRSRNLNAPAPITGIKPYGNAFIIYDFETSGSYWQNLLMTNLTTRFNRRVNLNANYTFGKATGDADGAGSFPANSYDLTTEHARSSFDVHHRFTLTGSIDAGHGISFFPLIIAATGAPFNIISGVDTNGDSLFLDRPAFAADLSRPSVRQTPFGNFDLQPLPGAQIIPRNYGFGPGYFSVNLRVTKTFGFGSLPQPQAQAQARPANGAAPAANAARPAANTARSEDKPYRLIIALAATNLFNRTNQGQPIGNLSSPLFGTSNSISQAGQNIFGPSAASNRTIGVRVQFTF